MDGGSLGNAASDRKRSHLHSWQGLTDGSEDAGSVQGGLAESGRDSRHLGVRAWGDIVGIQREVQTPETVQRKRSQHSPGSWDMVVSGRRREPEKKDLCVVVFSSANYSALWDRAGIIAPSCIRGTDPLRSNHLMVKVTP